VWLCTWCLSIIARVYLIIVVGVGFFSTLMLALVLVFLRNRALLSFRRYTFFNLDFQHGHLAYLDAASRSLLLVFHVLGWLLLLAATTAAAVASLKSECHQPIRDIGYWCVHT